VGGLGARVDVALYGTFFAWGGGGRCGCSSDGGGERVDLSPPALAESGALLAVVRLTRGMMSAARERYIRMITKDLTMKKFSLNEPTSEYQLYNLTNVPQANNSRPALCAPITHAHCPGIERLRKLHATTGVKGLHAPRRCEFWLVVGCRRGERRACAKERVTRESESDEWCEGKRRKEQCTVDTRHGSRTADGALFGRTTKSSYFLSGLSSAQQHT